MERLKRILMAAVLACLAGLLAAGCSDDDSSKSKTADEIPVPTGPGEKVVFSDNLKIPTWPQSVIPYGGGTDMTLLNLGDGKVDFVRRSDREFELVVCYHTGKRLFIVTHSSKARHIYIAPTGRNGNNVAFTTSGYKLSGEARGTIEFSFIKSMYGMYDVNGIAAKVYVFCVDAKDDGTGREKNPDQPGPFQAISNVLEGEIKF